MKLLNIYNLVLESKKTEAQGMNLLRRGNIENPEEIIGKFANGDTSGSGKYVPAMAYIYATGYSDIDSILKIFDEYHELSKKGRIGKMVLQRDSINIGDYIFNNFIKLSEYIHGVASNYGELESEKVSTSVGANFQSKKKKLWSGNNIDIYAGDSVQKCIEYTLGGLVKGKTYSFCIGQPGNTMYKSYRDEHVASFYYIVDRNRFIKEPDGSFNLDDPLHMVVFDVGKDGIYLTDSDNRTGNISEYGNDVNGYIDYLKSKGVPVEQMVNKPKTSEEEYEDELLGKRNGSLEWFIKLPMKYKSAYIGRGHRLTDGQFDYLMK